MVGHRVTSPMLFGIKENSGLGSNADEIKNAYLLMDNTVIRPIQLGIIGALDELLAANNTALKLYFKPLSPLEFNDIKVTDQQTIEEETGVKAEDQVQMMDIVKNYNEGHITKPQAVTMMVHFAKVPAEVAQTLFSEASVPASEELVRELTSLGEDEDLEEWELVADEVFSEEDIVKMREVNFASTGSAFPNAKSAQDGVTKEGFKYKVRYAYAGENKGEREFCSLMLKAKKIYRFEDIDAMSGKSVNAGFGKGGAATYDILLYKGGPNCKHFWMRKTYLARAKGVTPDPKNKRSEVSVNDLRKLGVKLPVNDSLVAKPPISQDYRGYTKEYAIEHGIPK
jgi:hypothetical protein